MLNDVKEIRTTIALPSVPQVLATISGNDAQSVVVVDGFGQDYALIRANGNVFAWRTNPGVVPNNGTTYAGSDPNGYWEMQIPNGIVDIKWFGAHPVESAANNTVFIQSAFQYAIEKGYKLYISKGSYQINKTELDLGFMTSGNVGHTNPFVLYGDGIVVSQLIWCADVNPIQINDAAITIKGYLNQPIEVSDLGILPITGQERQIHGLKFYAINPVYIKNVLLASFKTGLVLESVNTLYCNSATLVSNDIGIIGKLEVFQPPIPTNVYPTNPNLLNFESCTICNNRLRAAEITSLHSVTFQSCNISENGMDYFINNPNKASGIDCEFDGTNGANGLNIRDCYFEGNIGLADVRILQNTGGVNNPYFGSHMFMGNTFNRNNNILYGNQAYTNNCIIIQGTGQDLMPTYYYGQFGNSKCRLSFIGNGFFVKDPGSPNNYVPSPERRAIRIDYLWENTSNEPSFYEFDIVELGNAYAGIVDAPIFSRYWNGQEYKREFNDRTAQVSEYTRVKAFGIFNITRIDGNEALQLTNSYNVWSIERHKPRFAEAAIPGMFKVTFANELQTLPVPVVTPVTSPYNADKNTYANPIAAVLIWLHYKSFVVQMLDTITGQPVDASFTFNVQ